MEISFWNRQKACTETELIFGEGAIRWFYETPSGFLLTRSLLSRRIFSTLYGKLQDLPASAKKIPEFVRKFEIPMDDFEPAQYKSFNEFFIRKFRPGKRPIETTSSQMPAFAEGRYLAYENLTRETRFPIKGLKVTATELLGSEAKARPFQDGPAFIARLCPVDYHRYHYPAAGTTLDSYPIHGSLHSVNPIALKAKPDVFITNERRVAILETPDFGRLAFIEVGALCVGKIVQSHPESQPFARGQEKGYFLFGGSSIVLLGEKGKWKPHADLLTRTSQDIETLVRLGEAIAARS